MFFRTTNPLKEQVVATRGFQASDNSIPGVPVGALLGSQQVALDVAGLTGADSYQSGFRLTAGWHFGADGSSLYEPVSERVVAELAGLLRAGQEAGAFGAFSPMVVARTLRGSIDALEPVLRHHPEVDLDAYAAELVAIFEKVTAP